MIDAPQPDADGIYAHSGFRLPLPGDETGDPQKCFDNNDPVRGRSTAGARMSGRAILLTAFDMQLPPKWKLAMPEASS